MADPQVFKYMRSSTGKQNFRMQSHKIHKYIRDHKLPYGHCAVDTCKGDVPWKLRNLSGIMAQMRWGDLLIVYDLTRLGREFFVLMEIIIDVFKRGGKIVNTSFNYVIEPRMMDHKMRMIVEATGAEVEYQNIKHRNGDAAEAKRMKLERAEMDRVMRYKIEHNESELDTLLKRTGFDLSNYYALPDLERDQAAKEKERLRRLEEWRNKPHALDRAWNTIETMHVFGNTVADIARHLDVPYNMLYYYMTRKGLVRRRSDYDKIYVPGC